MMMMIMMMIVMILTMLISSQREVKLEQGTTYPGYVYYILGMINVFNLSCMMMMMTIFFPDQGEMF